ncbi:MAG: ankyrin repeat domain-containing protein [Candidatus Babeliales bacterium]|jgi:ankyrin repeat protein
MKKLMLITMLISLTMSSSYCMLAQDYQWQASTAIDDDATDDIELEIAGQNVLPLDTDNFDIETETHPQIKVDENGNTALHLLVSDWHYRSDTEKQYVKQLIDEYAYLYVNRSNNKGQTPLHLAIDSKDTEIIVILLGAGANINEQDNNGNTPLFSACWIGTEETIKMLIDAGANVNMQNYKGHTPLHVAVWNDQINTLEALLRAGADFNISDKNGNSPLNDAIQHRHPEIAKIFNSFSLIQ